MKQLQGTAIRSVGTARNYENALVRAAEFTDAERIVGGLQGMTLSDIARFQEQRGQVVGQKTLDMERQALQAMCRHITGRLAESQTLPVLKSELTQSLKSRAYTGQQIALVANAQRGPNALATELAHAAGLRAHELLTLRRASERAPDVRPTRAEKFLGRDGALYTVHGKGGLTRHVLLPHPLAARLEVLRLGSPVAVNDRGVHYQQHYDLAGGHRWSSSYSAASSRALGWTAGAHGLRHSYAQERMRELQSSGLSRADALEVVSQELGHFRPDITEVYLR
jgi:integrase